IDRPTAAGPEHLILNLVGLDGAHMETERAVSLVRQAAALRDDLVVTLAGERGVNDLADALDHDGLARVAHAAAGAGALAVHARTPALAERERVLGLLDLGLDAVSIDVVANDAYTYELLTGRDGFDRSRENVNALLSARAERVSADGVPLPWFIARITRRDAIYEQIDALYDRWLLACGAAVLDPLPEPIVGERIEPLPAPVPVAERMEKRQLVVMPGLVSQSGVDMRDGIAEVWAKSGDTRAALVGAV
ncbi:MAG: hypothetical protein AAFY46_05375, partial [Planctomycetota bacterium]